MVRNLAALSALLSFLAFGTDTVSSGEADIIAVEVVRAVDGTYRIEATVRHADASWEHYADRWEVLAPDGTKLGTRVLLHPHDDEQPFTRRISAVRIPSAIKEVILRAHDSRHGYGGREYKLSLP